MIPQRCFFIIFGGDVPDTQVLFSRYSEWGERGGKDTKSPGMELKRVTEVCLWVGNTKSVVYGEEGAGDGRHIPLESGIKLQRQGFNTNGLGSCISSIYMLVMLPCSHNNAKTRVEMKG